MELGGEERHRPVPYPFVGVIIHIEEQRFPVLAESPVVHGKTVVLGSDEALVCPDHPDRLVVAAMTVFQLVGLRPSGLAQQLVAHADPEDRLAFGHSLPDMLYRDVAEFRIARAVGYEQSVIVEGVEVSPLCS